MCFVAQLIVDIVRLLFIYTMQSISNMVSEKSPMMQLVELPPFKPVFKRQCFFGEMVIEIKRTWDIVSRHGCFFCFGASSIMIFKDWEIPPLLGDA